jgi:hypothetical protein
VKTNRDARGRAARRHEPWGTFLGSGSSLIAAQNTGWICRVVEIDPLYVAVIVLRF